jgi:hypothetical protein
LLKDFVKWRDIPARILLSTPWKAKPNIIVKMADVARKGVILIPSIPFNTRNKMLR